MQAWRSKQCSLVLSCLPLIWVACGDEPAVQQPRAQLPSTLTFASPAARYNDTTEPPPSSALGDLILAQVRDSAIRAGRRPPVADERLYLAAAALATVVPEDGTIAYPVTQFSLQANGVIEPSPHLLVLWTDLKAPGGGDIAHALRPRLDEIFRAEEVSFVGLGAVIRGPNGYGALVLGLMRSRLHTSPIPRSLAADGVADFDIVLQVGLRDPRLFVTLPSGIVEHVDLQAKDADTFTAHLDCRGVVGKMQVELVTGSEEGGASIANFPVWCGAESARSIAITQPLNDIPADPSKAEKQIFELVNAERSKLGRPPLQWDEALATVAREHSQDMRRTQVVGAKIPHGLSIKQRVLATRNDLAVTGSVARAYGVAEAHRGLIDLPSTRQKLISDVATKIGIGIVYGEPVAGRRELYLTQIIARPASGLFGR